MVPTPSTTADSGTLSLPGGRIFRHSAWDGLLVLISLLTVTIAFVGAWHFAQLSLPALVMLAMFFIIMTCTNYQCVAHNFLHNPFFKSAFLNKVFSVLNSLALGMPQTLYRIHHYNHHRFNNDFKDSHSNTTRDWSSIYRYSKAATVPEPAWKYALLGPLRADFRILYEQAKRKNLLGLVHFEIAASIAFYLALTIIDWRFVFAFFVPVSYLGQAISHLENYLEHYGADPSSRKTNSVSCYSPLYNLLWFNNGYHQEHHYRPAVHWRLIPRVKAEMLPEQQRRVVRGMHLFNLVLPVPSPVAGKAGSVQEMSAAD